MNNTYFIKKFKVGDNYYIYDVNSNSFLKVDDLLFTLLDGEPKPGSPGEAVLGNYSTQEIDKAKSNIELMKEKGYLSSHQPDISFFTMVPREKFIDDLKERHQEQITRMVLVVTESCNLRCRYCAYSGKYLYHRKHNKKNMTPEVMRKAIDFYLKRSGQFPEKLISFYGGEPLINFDLIKECVSYVKSKHDGPVIFNMTINGTLLNEERMKFLAENNFSIIISADGPEEIHDRNRVYRNGKGSYRNLVEKLRTFKKLYPEYYKNKIRFNMVLNPPADYEAINSFISKPEISPGGVRFSFVDPQNTNYFDQFTTEQLDEFKERSMKQLAQFNQKVINDDPLNMIEQNLFRVRYLDIHRRDMRKLPDRFPAHGQCVIGVRNLTVNPEGAFNFCTMMEDVFNMGNLDDGFDYDRIKEIYYDLDDLFKDRCKGCWAIRFCKKCLKDLNKDGKVDEGQFNKFCKKEKESILNEMKDYITIRQLNNKALEYLQEIEVA